MNLTCPSCDTIFEVTPEELGQGGRAVRCGNCGHDWFQGQAAEPLVTEKPAPPASGPRLATETPAPVSEEPRSNVSAQAGPRPLFRPPKRARSSLAVGWMSLALFVVGLGAGLYFGKDRIISAVPSAAKLYQLAGLAPEQIGFGFELRQVTSVRRLVNGERVVVIQGLVANVTEGPKAVPRLRAVVTDADGVQVDQWTFSAVDERLPPGGTSKFETSTTNPPREGNLSIDFVISD